MRRLCVGGYFFSWMGASALLAYVPLAIGWERAGLSRRLGIDDGLVALVLPIGAALGAWAAARTRPGRKLRLVFLVAGPLIIVASAWFTRSFLAASARTTGSGPFAGLGELILAGMTFVLGVFGALVLGIWLFGTLAKFPDVEPPSIRPGPVADR